MTSPTDRFALRERGRAVLGPTFDYLLFLRWKQWPILTCQLAVSVLVAPAIVDCFQRDSGGLACCSWPVLGAAWFVWVVCLNGGTLAFNSAYDRDEEDIAYLRRPPRPPLRLAGFSLILMSGGGVLGFLVHPWFGILTTACIGLSILYSHPRTRWKGLPGLDMVVNVLGYGAATTLAGLLAGQAAGGQTTVMPDRAGWQLVAAFGLLFGSLYPLTQLYQLAADCARGDRTLATALGRRSSLSLALWLGAGAAFFFMQTTWQWGGETDHRLLIPLAVAMAAWLGHLLIWRLQATRWSPRDHERGMYRALLLWAVVDLAVLLSRYGDRLLG